MIDTIVLRIHDTRKYNNLIKNMDLFNQQGMTTESISVKSSDVRIARKRGVKVGIELIDALRMNGTGEFLLRSKRAKHASSSGHYELTYFVNYTANYIELNFSIPKYLYGSNIIMFVDHLLDKHYSYHECANIEHNVNRSFDLLEIFLINFFKREFAGSPVDPEDVEVNRIDVCFNQLFRAKEDALKYLTYQKRQRKKYSRDEEGTMREYATSLMYTSQRYSAKIYHKGSEYEKHDRKEHLKINERKRKQVFRTDEYQTLADRILRYELTIRHTMLNYLHKNALFRRKCPSYKRYHAVYLQVENSIQRNDRISKKIGTLAGEEKERYQLEHPYDKILADDRKVHRYVSQLKTKRTYFKLAVNEKTALYNKQTVAYDCVDALFSRNLLRLCMRKLLEFMNEYQIKELPPDETVSQKIEGYNSVHKKKLPKNEMMSFYRDLLKVGSFKEIAKVEHYSRATLYRYKERFLKIGITEQNLIPLTESGIYSAPLDLRDYHGIHMFNPRFLNKKRVFDIL